MNYRSKIFMLSGLFAFCAIFLSKKLFFSYYFGDEGINLLPISLFELVIFAIAFLTFVIILISLGILVKRNADRPSFKKRFHFLIPCFMAWSILFLMLQQNLSAYLVPTSLVLYGMILLNLNRFVSSKLIYFGMSLCLLGVISYLVPNQNWLFLTLGFGVFPIIFGLVLLRKYKKGMESVHQ